MLLLDEADSEYQRETLEQRLSKLTGGAAKFMVGGRTDTEVKEIKDRVVDAIAATRASIQEGIVPGGGVTLLRLSNYLENQLEELQLEHSEKKGYSTFAQAIRAPFETICWNAGIDPEPIIEMMIVTNQENGDNFFDIENCSGFNAASEQFVSDMFDFGIIDPVKVTRSAVRNAVSIASLVLASGAVVVNEPEQAQPMMV
jgi:chaperonin GroEL